MILFEIYYVWNLLPEIFFWKIVKNKPKNLFKILFYLKVTKKILKKS